MAKISKKTIDSLKEFMNRGCDYSGTQEFVDDTISETLKECGSKYPYGDEIGLVDADGEFTTADEFANLFYDKIIEGVINVLRTEK